MGNRGPKDIEGMWEWYSGMALYGVHKGYGKFVAEGHRRHRGIGTHGVHIWGSVAVTANWT